MDFKELLKKYMRHVGYSEGTWCLSYMDEEHFTEEEWSILQKLMLEIAKET